jgi:hypothetical protein
MASRNPRLSSVPTSPAAKSALLIAAAARSMANLVLVQIEAGDTMLRIATQYHPGEETHVRYLGLARKALRLAEKGLWNSPLNPKDVLKLSAEVERLGFQIDAHS